jgi:hypothetical protein
MARLRVMAPLLALCIAALLLPSRAAAQETTGTIQGRIVDSQGLPVPGVTVSITGSQGLKKATTDTDGRFSAPFLTPGTYTVRAELQGFKTVEQKNAVVATGQTLSVSLKMEVGGISEVVSVQDVPPTIDITSTTTGAVISSDFANTVPVGRRISDVTYMAPGVSSSGTAGRMNPSIAGGSGLDNQYVIDGANVTNQGYGALGSYSVIFGSLGNATPYDFVKDVQVKTGGYEAEYGQAIGGVVNVTTKSGSNDFHGSLFGYSQPTGLEGTYKQYQSANGTVQTLSSQASDAGAEGGGPVFKNRLFFFAAVDPQWETKTFQAPDDILGVDENGQPKVTHFALRDLGGIDRKRSNTSYSTKATWQLNANNRIDASFFGDPSKGDLGPQRTSALLADTGQYSSLIYGGHNQTVRYNGVVGRRLLLEATFAHSLNRISEVPAVDQWNISDQTVTPTINSGGIGLYEQGNRSTNNQFIAKATSLLGRHSIKYGVEYDDVVYEQLNQRTGPTFTAPDGRQTATGAQITILPDVNFGKIYRVTRANFNSGRNTPQKYTSFFAQDEWRVSNRLTINPGLRYEQETMGGTIIKSFTLKNNWAPRLGVTYDPFGNGNTKLYASYGRFYARVPNDLAARALSADDSISLADYFDANLTQPIPNGVATVTPTGAVTTNHFGLAGVGADTIDPSAKLSYVNEAIAGMDRALSRDTSVGVRYIHRDIGRVLEDVANAPLVAYFIGVPGLSSVEYILTNPSHNTPILDTAQFLGASFDDPTHKYDAVELTFNRRLDNNWSMMASYRYSKLRGNFEGFYRDDNGQSDPGITSLYDFPTNDPSFTGIGGTQFGFLGDIRFLGQSGPLPLDRPHQVKVFGTYTALKSLNLGVALNLSSGKPLTPLASNPEYTNGGEIPTAPRGSGFQTVDGFLTRSPFESQVDLQASYDINFGKGRQITLLADAYNIFNERRTTDYNNFVELEYQSLNPDFGTPTSQIVSGPQYQAPFLLRIGARVKF